MSMDTLTIFQTTGIFCAYLFTTVGLPAFSFAKKIKKHRLLERLVFYYMTGNFYIMNLVFFLQLLKISYPVTLILGTFVPAILARAILSKEHIRQFVETLFRNLKKLNERSLGRRTARRLVLKAIARKISSYGKSIVKFLLKKLPDCILAAFLLVLLFLLYGNNLLQEYGYKASDMPVHNFWINELGDNHIFAAGVYPYGFHCVIYYLHAFFLFDTYVILRVFSFVQNVMVHLMLLSFLKLCCKSKYAAYLGTLLYAGSNFFAGNTYSRFYATLPQEFGMIFIFPAIYFGFSYFEARKTELAREQERLKIETKEEKKEEEPKAGLEEGRKKGIKKKIKMFRWQWKESHWYLLGFAMSFSMTLAVHFYGTMIAGVFCIGMAIGYGFLFFRKEYFKNVVVTCLLSVTIAVLPMALAYIGGTPLQGSLGWGLNVIRGDKQEEADEAGSEDSAIESVQDNRSESDIQEKKEPLTTRIKEKFKTGWEAIYRAISASVLRLPNMEKIYWIMDGFVVLIILGIIFIFLRQSCYGAMLISSGLYMIFMGVMMSAGTFGLPALMDSNRGGIYFAYSLPIAASFIADAILFLLFLPIKKKFLMHFLSFACVILTTRYVWQNGYVKEPRNTKGQEMNEAIVCTTNIIENEEDFTWTIVSANDELRMGTDHGYHYETITFLDDMEKQRRGDIIRIPTPLVYIYIEKIPLDYYVHYEGSGQRISEEGASHPLPRNSGINMYQGEQRWILMSRMYYWAQEFKKLYPNEMETYLETDRFVCYRIEQNMYRLYDFSIDYGYNTQDYR